MHASTNIGVIGGSGFAELSTFESGSVEQVDTRYGEPSSPLTFGTIQGHNVVFLARHGPDHTILPHEINYRANLWALKQNGVSVVIAIATVGGIGSECHPGCILIPDQILDYTHSRQNTFSPIDGKLIHIDFTEPYCQALRQLVVDSAEVSDVDVIATATYAATQGPRFESAAEIDRLERDGAHIVGMTGMPEACLARELGMCYATIALVVNYAAGRAGAQINIEEIQFAYKKATININKVLAEVVPKLQNFDCSVPPVITP